MTYQNAILHKGEMTRKIILDTLRGATEPVTAREVVEQINAKRGVKYTTSHVHAVLQLLEDQGTVFSRLENKEDTVARGAVAYHYGVRLYWAGGPELPARKSSAVFSGIDVSSLGKAARRAGYNAYQQRKKSTKKSTKQTVRPGKATTMQTDSLEVFNLKLRIAELEAQLSSIKKILS